MQRSEGREVGKVGIREPLQVTPTLGDQEAEELGYEAADAAKRGERGM